MPCQVTISGVKIVPGKANVTLEMKWNDVPQGLKKGEVTITFLFSPHPTSALGPDIFKLPRLPDPYILTMHATGFYSLVSGVEIKTADGKEDDGALVLFGTLDKSSKSSADLRKIGKVLFGTQTKSATDLRKSGKFTFPIPIQSPVPPNPLMGEPAIPAIQGEGTLYVAVFKQDDPSLDQRESTKYKQLSNVASKSVNLK